MFDKIIEKHMRWNCFSVQASGQQVYLKETVHEDVSKTL